MRRKERKEKNFSGTKMILSYLFEFVDCFSALGDSGHEVGGGRAGEVLPHLPDEVMHCDHARHLEALLNLTIGVYKMGAGM